jgi:nitroreductase
MSLSKLLSQRRMVRNYLEQPVETETLERTLQAALRGPSAGHSQGVSLVVIQRAETRQQLAQLSGESNWVARGYPAWLSRAPVHVVICAEPQCYQLRYAEPDKAQARTDWPVPYWFVDAGCAFMLLLLAAAEEGLAAGFQGIHNLPGLNAALSLPPEVEPIGLVTLGYAADRKAGHSVNRGPRPGRIHRERW